MSLLSMQIRAGMLILLIIVIRQLFLHKLSKGALKGMWAFVLLRFFLPFSHGVVAGFSLPFDKPFSFPFTNGAALSSQQVAVIYEPSLISPAFAIYLAVGLIAAAYFIAGHIRCRKIYRYAYPAVNEAVLKWKRKNGLRRSLRVLLCPDITSALTYGVIHPVILIPANIDFKDEERLFLVLSHELEHVKRFDILWKWGSALALCLYWYNPLVWAMFILMNRDIELSCDERVLKGHGFTGRIKRDYALTLIALAESNKSRLPLAAHFGGSAVEERIVSIMRGRYAKIYSYIALGGVALLALLSFAVFFIDDCGMVSIANLL